MRMLRVDVRRKTCVADDVSANLDARPPFVGGTMTDSTLPAAALCFAEYLSEARLAPDAKRQALKTTVGLWYRQST